MSFITVGPLQSFLIHFISNNLLIEVNWQHDVKQGGLFLNTPYNNRPNNVSKSQEKNASKRVECRGRPFQLSYIIIIIIPFSTSFLFWPVLTCVCLHTGYLYGHLEAWEFLGK